MPPRPVLAILATLCLTATLPAQTTIDLAAQIVAMTQEPAVAHAHWGVMVTAMDGSPLFALNEGQFFQPASNAKLFTTAAALALLGRSKQPYETRLIGTDAVYDGILNGDLQLVGGGDPDLSGQDIPYSQHSSASQRATPPDPTRYLAELADTAVAKGLKVVKGDVVGDDTLFPYEPYATDWAIDDLLWGYGAPVSALSFADNQLRLTVEPGALVNDPAVAQVEGRVRFYTLDLTVRTVPFSAATRIHIERQPGSRILRVSGTIALKAAPDVEEIAIDDPAEYAAMVLKQMLEDRGVKVFGSARALHSPAMEREGFLKETRKPMDQGLFDGKIGIGCADYGRPELRAKETVLATHASSPLSEDIVATNKESLNLHAELLLHHLGKSLTCTGSIADGARVVRSFAIYAGVDPSDIVLFDGSGLSGHDLVTPRAIAKLLQFASTQPWFATYKESLPVGGVDGTLESRFTKPPLQGHVFAKTGTLGEARALSGYLECASGRTVIFSILSGNHAPGSHADREVMDRIVAAIVAAN